jgi:hypothetical protein
MVTYEKLTTVLFWDNITDNISIGRISTASSLFVMKYKGRLIETIIDFNLQGEVFKKTITVFFDSYQLTNSKDSLILSLNGNAFGSISIGNGILFIYSEADHDDIYDFANYTSQREWQKMNEKMRAALQKN